MSIVRQIWSHNNWKKNPSRPYFYSNKIFKMKRFISSLSRESYLMFSETLLLGFCKFLNLFLVRQRRNRRILLLLNKIYARQRMCRVTWSGVTRFDKIWQLGQNFKGLWQKLCGFILYLANILCYVAIFVVVNGHM